MKNIEDYFVPWVKGIPNVHLSGTSSLPGVSLNCIA